MSLLDIVDTMPHAIYWTCDEAGNVTNSVGGALRLLGLTRDAVVGRHVSEFGGQNEARWLQAMEGFSGVARDGDNTWGPTAGRTYVVTWGPLMDGGKIVGMSTLTIDVTSLTEEAAGRVESMLGELMPLAQRLIEQEAEVLASRIKAETAKHKRLEDASERRWLAIKHTATWVSEKLGTPIAIIVTAIAVWFAAKLNVLEPILAIFWPAS